ncbi:MAG: hypothetical protein ACTSXT_01320 [Candidatus Helarchaeota archaeon]
MADRNTSIRRQQLKPIREDDLEAINSPSDGYVPSWNVSQNKFEWVSNAGGVSTLEGLTDVDFDSGTPTDNQALIYDSVSGKWKAEDVLFLDQTTPQTIINGVPLLNTTPNGAADLKSFVNKEYVDLAVTSLGASYYMYDEDDATGYKTCYLNPSGDAETYIEGAGLSDDDYLGGWISAPGEAPTKLLKGIYDWFLTTEKITGTKNLRVYWKLIERKADTSEVVVATSSNSNIITDKETYLVPLQLTDDYIPDSGSRIVGKLYADVSGEGNAPTIRIYYQGGTSSRWEIPANTEILDNRYLQNIINESIEDLSDVDFDSGTPTDGQVLTYDSGSGKWKAETIDDTDTFTIGITIDNQTSEIGTGYKGFIRIPYAGTITKATLLADQSGSIVIDIWKCSYSDYDAGSTHPVDGDSITASAPPTLSSATKSEDSTLTDWTKSITAGDVLGFNVDSCTDITKVVLILEVTKT